MRLVAIEAAHPVVGSCRSTAAIHQGMTALTKGIAICLPEYITIGGICIMCHMATGTFHFTCNYANSGC